jgi:hypothetical protein
MNCGAIPTGPYCQECSQHQDDLHRPILTLAREVLASFIDLDGRLWRTLPRLFFTPASLTRDYLAGHRVSQMPPLRMLLLALVLTFLLASLQRHQAPTAPASSRPQPTAPAARMAPPRAIDHQAAPGDPALAASPSPAEQAARKAELNEWVQRLALLSLPFAALTLGLLFVFDRRFMMFDHLVVSMHSLTVQAVLFSVVELARSYWLWAGWLWWAIPVHIYVHLKGVYELSVIGTVLRMLGILVLGFLSFIFFVLVVAVVSGNYRNG